MGPLIPLLVGAGSAIYNAISSGAQDSADRDTANRNVDKTIAANRALADSAFAQNKEMWLANNEYNSPEQQMARLRTAGLNPNLVYGNGAVGNSSGAIPQYQAPKESYDYKAPLIMGQMPNAFLAYQDMQMRQAQTDNVRAQTEATRVKTSNDMVAGRFMSESYDQRLSGLGHANDLAEYRKIAAQNENTRNSEFFPYQLEALKYGAKRSALTNDKIFQDILFRKYQNEWMKSGITTSDNPLLRQLAPLIGASKDYISSWFSKPKK